MSIAQKSVRFILCLQIFLGLIFSTSFSKAFNIGEEFNYSIHAMVLLNLMIHLRYFFEIRMAILILIFTFISSFVNGFAGLKLGMVLNFLTFSAVELALVADTFKNNKLFFKLYYLSAGILLFSSIFLIMIGVNTQPFSGMYMAVKVAGIPVQIWGLFSDKNVFGFSLMTFFLITVLLPDFHHKKKVVIISFIFIILSGNRSGLLTTCIVLIFLFMLNPNFNIGRKISVAIQASVLLAIIVFAYMNSPLNTRGVESNDREVLYAIAYEFIRNNFWFGIGRALIVDGEMVHTHNLYIQVLAEEGFLCLLIYIFLFLKVLIKGGYSTKVLCLSVFIFTGFNPMLVPGQLFTVTALVLLGRYVDELRAVEKITQSSSANPKPGILDVINLDTSVRTQLS